MNGLGRAPGERRATEWKTPVRAADARTLPGSYPSGVRRGRRRYSRARRAVAVMAGGLALTAALLATGLGGPARSPDAIAGPRHRGVYKLDHLIFIVQENR